MRVGALTDGHNQVLPEFKGFQPLWMADHDCYSDDTTLDERAEILEAKEMEQSCIRRFLELEEGGRLTNPAQEGYILAIEGFGQRIGCDDWARV